MGSKSKTAAWLGALWEIGWFLLLVQFLASQLRPAGFDDMFQNTFSGSNTCGSRYDFMRNCSSEYHHPPVEDIRNVSYFKARGSGLSAKEFLDQVEANLHTVSVVRVSEENFGSAIDLLSTCSRTWRQWSNFVKVFEKRFLRSSPTTDHSRSNEPRMAFVDARFKTYPGAVRDAGKLFLDRKELELERLAALGFSNVWNNSFDNYTFGHLGEGMNLDYEVSYLRLAPPKGNITSPQPEVAPCDTCLPKGLAPAWKNPSRPSELSLIYFGSASGIFRAFPGVDESDCAYGPYDARKRLWYLSVTKEVKIVIYVRSAVYTEKTYDTLFQIVSQFCNRQIDSEYVDALSFTTQSLVGTYKEMDLNNPLEWHDHSCSDSSTLTSSNGFITPSKSTSSKSQRFKSILFLGIIALFICILIIKRIEKKIYVFFKYNIESNAEIDDSESDPDEVDIEVGIKVDPNAEIIYENRNKGIVLESPRSQGSSGIVSTIMFFGVKCAMKIFHSNAKSDFRKETATLFELEHPHIVEIRCAFRDSTIIMERMDKDLSKFIDSKRDHNNNNNNNYNLPLEVAVEIMLQIAEGMSYLHQQGIAHGDLKSLNILLNEQGQVQDDNLKVTAKIADFGNARFFDPKNPKGFILLPQTNIGSRPWGAPELFHQSKRSFVASLLGMYPYVMPKPLDIYGFGIICHELIMGTYHRSPTLISSDRCPEGLVALVEDCCQPNPHKRPEFDDIRHRLLELRSSLALNGRLSGCLSSFCQH